MPSAGALVPPSITPLRKAVPGQPASHIDTATFINLETESPDCRVYFSTDGTKPNPYQLKVGGRETTFRYKGPFTLKPGKRTVKVIAVGRDGLRESNVITKTFTVDDVGPPDENVDLDSLLDMDSELDYTPTRTRRALSGPATQGSMGLVKKKKSLRNSSSKLTFHEPKEAWATTASSTFPVGLTDGLNGILDPSTQTSSSVQIPDGPFNPTNYSGTQVNFWGVAPGGNVPGVPPAGGYSMPYGGNQAYLGALTQQMLQKIEQPTVPVAEVRRLLQEQAAKFREIEPQPAIELPVVQDPEAKPESPGQGDWKGQLEHIYAHLIEKCRSDIKFRTAIAEPKMGKVIHADFDEEDDVFLLTVSVCKAGVVPRPHVPKKKIQSVVKAALKKPPPEKPPPEKPKPEKTKPQPKPKEKPKPKPAKPKEDPYFETEEYESDEKEKPKPKLKPKNRPKSRPKPSPDTLPVDDKPKTRRPRRDKKPKQKPSLPKEKPAEDSLSESDQDMVGLDSSSTSLPDYEPPPPSKPKETPEESQPEWVTDEYFMHEEYAQEGTLKPWEFFNSEMDSEVLRKAMKGLGTDENAIIDVMGYRSSTQRQDIVSTFKTMFGKDLKEELKGETSGNFKEALAALCLAPADYDASEIKRAVKGLGTDDDALIEILCTRTNKQIVAIKEAYQKLYQKDIEKDIKGDTSGHFKRLLVAQLQANREESATFDRTAAKADARALYEAGEKKWGTDESTFNKILCQRSFPHLRAVFEEYSSMSKKDMEEVIKSEFSGDIKNGLLTVVRVIKNKPLYFARKMQKAMKGLGTDDKALVRVMVSRCECDMVQIKDAFQQEFKGTLADWIRDDTSGDYQQILLALAAERAPPSPTAEEVEAAEGEPELEEVEEEQIEEEGTVKPAESFDPKKDSEVLRKAMKGLGTDEDAIIGVWGHRSNEQRQEIITMFKTMFGKDLIKELKGELSGKLKQSVVALGQAPAEYDANELRKAMKGLGTDEDALIEILCTRSNEEMAALQEAYTKIHNRKLEDDIISETSGHLKRLLVSMVQANRPEGNMIDRRKARQDAKALFEAGEKKFGTDESRFNVVLCSRSFPQLRATFDEFKKLSNKDIDESIKSEMSGDLKKGMLTIVQCVRNKSVHFAKRLYDSMKGLGTDDDTLIRVVVSRSEKDMVQIKQLFQQAYQQPLGQFIADDISGDYRKLILAIVAEEQFLKKKK